MRSQVNMKRLLGICELQRRVVLSVILSLLLKFKRSPVGEVAEQNAADNAAHQQIKTAMPAHFIHHHAKQTGTE